MREHPGLHKRYALKLRTGRRIRETRWRTRTGQGSRIRKMVMIDQRPAEIETKETAGHWEGDLIVGVGSASAMVTLRERKTQYGMVINLPRDHTAASVNSAGVHKARESRISTAELIGRCTSPDLLRSCSSVGEAGDQPKHHPCDQQQLCCDGGP